MSVENNGVRRVVAAAGLLLLTAGPASAQPDDERPEGERSKAEAQADQFGRAVREFHRLTVPNSRKRSGARTLDTFHEVVADVSAATVRIRSKSRTRALGGVVGADGWVLTKASRLGENPTVLLKDRREFDARVVGFDRDHDLAVLKIEASGLPTLTLDDTATASPGDWVATPSPERDPVAIGVVSVLPREIAHRSGYLGVRPDDVEGGAGAIISEVLDNSGAKRAGLLVNDIILRVNDDEIQGRQDLIDKIGKYSPLDKIELTIRRGDETIVVPATLSGRTGNLLRGGERRSNYQNNLGSRLSQRRFGFPTALQHDTVLKPEHCGGPLVDLDGRVIGFNIARAGRTESYAIPTSAVTPLLFQLMSGNQPPGDSPDEQ